MKRALNIVVTIFFLTLLIYFTNYRELINTLSQANLFFFLVSLLLALLFTLLSAYRWYLAIHTLGSNPQKSLRTLIVVSYKKEFFASFTSNIVGDIYGALAAKGVSKAMLVSSTILTRYLDLILILPICILAVSLKSYLMWEISVPLLMIFLTVTALSPVVLKNVFVILKRSANHRFFSKLVMLKEIKDGQILPKLFYASYGATIVMWGVRMMVSYFTFSSFGTLIDLASLLFITFVPIIMSITVMFLPKSIAGDSSAVALGLILALDYNLLIGYVILHRIYSLATAAVGLIAGLL